MNSTVNFYNNIFKNNLAELGGAIYIDNANNVLFKDNQFLNNSAISHTKGGKLKTNHECCKGGAIYIKNIVNHNQCFDCKVIFDGVNVF